jgi:hypothetical protein
MVFPTDPLKVKAEIALGADITGDPALWSWTDISAKLRTADGSKVVVNRGRRNDSGSTSPSTATFDLENGDGRFCTQNPLSPYFPLLQVNTPIRLSASTDSGGSWSTRFSGYLSKLPNQWRGPAGSDSWVSVTADSILRRLGTQGAHSPLYWTAPNLPSSNTGCIEYWPMEDGKNATECSSFFPDGIAMTVTGSIELGASSPPAGSEPTPHSDYEFMKANPPSATGIVRPYAGTGEWNVLGAFKIESDTAWSTTLMDCDINKSEGSTQPDRLRLVVTDTKLVLHVYQEDDTLLGTLDTGAITTKPPGDGEWHAVAVRAAQSGSDISFRIRYEGVTYTHSLTSKTLGTIRKVSFPAPTINTAPDLLAVGHLAVYDDDLPITYIDRYANAMNAFLTGAGETTSTRLNRLDEECALLYSMSTSSTESAMYERLGEQPKASILGVIADAVEADGGILFEPRDFGSGSLRYRARSLLNANTLGAPALTLTQADFSILEQGDDDHYLATQATVSGAGSSATASVSAVENEISASRNVRYPDRLPDHAGWVLYQGTRRDYRYPRIQVLLHGATGQIAAWKVAELGDRVLIPDPPPGVVDSIDLILEGYQESMDQFSWVVELYCSPASRYRIARLDHTEYGRMDTAGSSLVNALTSSATTFDVETYEGPEWTTSAGFDIGIGGERMTTSAIAGSFTDSFTRSVSNGWGTSTSGHAWSTNGGVAADYSVNGTRGIISLGAVNALRSTYIDTLPVANLDRTFITRIPVLATGAGILVRQAARWDVAANSYYAAALQVETDQSVTAQLQVVLAGTVTTLASRTVAGLTHGTTTDFRIRFRLDGPRLFMKIWGGSTEPPQWTLTAYDTQLTAAGVWGCRVRLNSGNTNALPVLLQFDTDATLHPQRFTVTRAVNTVSKSHAAGASVGLFQPNYVGL